MATLPPPPINDKPGSFTWLEWYRQLRNYVSTSGSVPWYIINFAGSNITDIARRDHNNLQGLQGGASGQMYHLTGDQAGGISNALEARTTDASITLPTTPTVLIPTTTIYSNGISYNNSTGEITFVNGGAYNLSLMVNADSPSAGVYIYFYGSIDVGDGYVDLPYSGRSQRVNAIGVEQAHFTSNNYFAKGTKLKLYLWSSVASTEAVTTAIPGTSTIYIPAVRLMFTGSL